MTNATPIKQPPLSILRNAMEVCTAYEDTKTVAPESAQQQLPRIHALLCMLLAQLSEPHGDTVRVVRLFLNTGEPQGAVDERTARDAAAAILNSAMTWSIGEDYE